MIPQMQIAPERQKAVMRNPFADFAQNVKVAPLPDVYRS